VLGPLAAIAFFVVLALAIGRSVRRRDPRAAEAALLRACYGDRDQAERLIAAELGKRAGLSRGEAAARALERGRASTVRPRHPSPLRHAPATQGKEPCGEAGVAERAPGAVALTLG
jgi:hypothetical protein